ncbi:MAG: hypothetical protein K2K95_10070, partial [Muribaculaceae bacterium]|nr:hypothetical protein [Muribaculaceae bacterium]
MKSYKSNPQPFILSIGKRYILLPTHAFLILIMILIACSRHSPDQCLIAIDQTIEENPNKVLSQLMAMNPDSLDDSSRHFRNLLIIKASDKAYITHTSDSLILDVMDYYGTRQDDSYYPEALYYGGRVYYDLGDLPTALDFFQKAVDNLPNSEDNLRFRANILSQTGHILNRLRLYDEANSCLKEVVDIDRKLNDTSNLPLDILALVSNQIHNNNFSLARDLIVETLKNDSLPEEDRRNLWVLLAVTKYKTENITEALRIIQNEGKALNDNEQSDILSYRAQIYYRARMLDSAYVMAKRLIKHPVYINKRIGYRILISPEIRPRIPSDSLNYYIDEYSDGMEAYLDENANQATLIQQASYNYSRHARSNDEAVRENSKLHIWLTALLAIMLMSCVAYIILRIRNKRNFLDLHGRLENTAELINLKNEEVKSLQHKIEELSKLKDEEVILLKHEIVELSNSKKEEIAVLQQKLVKLSECQNKKIEDVENKKETATSTLDNSVNADEIKILSDKNIPDINDLRNEIIEKLNTFITNKENLPVIPSEILHSDIYSYIQTRLNNDMPIPDDNNIWEKIQTVINTV